MACRGCSSSDGCGCSVLGSGSIHVTGSGTPVSAPFVVGFDIDDALSAVTVDDSTPCGSLNNPHVPVLLGTGSTIMVPLPCSSSEINRPVPGNAFAWTYSTTTTDADPGSGNMRLNNATMSSVTSIFVDLTEANGTDVTDWLDSLDDAAGTPKGRIRLYSRSDPARWADFKLSSVTTATGYRKLVVVYNDHANALQTIARDTVIDFSPSSDTTGATGAAGAPGGFNSVQSIVAITGTYTLLLTDLGALLKANSASAFTITVPPNSSVGFPVGGHIDFFQYGAGQVTIAAGAGVTIRSNPGLKLFGQYTGATLIKAATDEWYLVGNLTS